MMLEQIVEDAGLNLGQCHELSGYLIDLSTDHVDWEALRDGAATGVGPVGRALLALAHEFARAGR